MLRKFLSLCSMATCGCRLTSKSCHVVVDVLLLCCLFYEIISFFQVDPFDFFDAFFDESNGPFGRRGEPGGMNFNSRSKGNQGLDVR